MKIKFTRLQVALIIAIVIFLCSCGRWVPGNQMKYHHFYKPPVHAKDTTVAR